MTSLTPNRPRDGLLRSIFRDPTGRLSLVKELSAYGLPFCALSCNRATVRHPQRYRYRKTHVSEYVMFIEMSLPHHSASKVAAESSRDQPDDVVELRTSVGAD